MPRLCANSIADFDLALTNLPPRDRGLMAYHLDIPYQRIGRNRRALELYEESLEIDEAANDSRGIVVTQSAMAYVLQQMGKPQEALALYEESLATKVELGDVREIAVTQSAMADVLMQMGKPQEALALYEESLATIQELGDVRSIAVTQANFGHFLLQQGEQRRALEMLWVAHETLVDAGYAADANAVRQLLIQVKTQVLGLPAFDDLWPHTVPQRAQPDWLAVAQPTTDQPGPARLPQDQQEALVANTVAVLTATPEQRDEWRTVIAQARQQFQGQDMGDLVALVDAILALLDGRSADLSADNEYFNLWQRIQEGIAQGGPPSTAAADDDPEAAARVAAIQAFVQATDADAKRAVYEAEQTHLTQPEVQAIFTQSIDQARNQGDQRWADTLQLHLDLLRACSDTGIDAAFAAWEEQISASASAAPDEGEAAIQLPFDPDLLTQTVAALRGSPQDRLAHLQTVQPLAAAADDPDQSAFWTAVQMALVGSDLHQAGQALAGNYAAIWAYIVAAVTDDGPTTILDLLVRYTVAVLGPAAGQLEEWRTQLEDLRAQAAQEDQRGLADLIETILALLDAGGNPQGLGAGLEGIYAQTWQQLVQQLTA